MGETHAENGVHARRARRSECEWREDEDGVWQTGCGHAFTFEDGGPVENQQRFCGYCGARLVEVALSEREARRG